MRMRTLDRWSAVSLAMTAPSPVHGEPLRPPSGRLLGGMARLVEIAVVDLVEARRGKVDAEQLDLGGEMPGDLGAQIALAIDPVALVVRPGAERLHPHHPGHRGKAVGNAPGICAGSFRGARLDIDDMAAAEHAPGQLGDGAGEGDAA